MPIVILLWAATLSYAFAESGRFLIKHQKLSTIGALLGQTAVTASSSTITGPQNIPAGGIANLIVRYASSALGKPYGWGQPAQCSGTIKAYDCSGLTRCAALYATNGGLNLPHNTVLQLQQLRAYRVNKSGPAHWQPGDFIYYFIPSEINQGEPAHVAIYIGSGKVIDAPHTGTVVQVDDWNLGRVMAVVRPAMWSTNKAGSSAPAGAAA